MWCSRKRHAMYTGWTTRPVRKSEAARLHSNTLTGRWSRGERIMVIITARLATTANMANGMLTTVITVSLMYTDWTLTAFRIQEGRHSSELSWFKTMLLTVWFKPAVSLTNMFFSFLAGSTVLLPTKQEKIWIRDMFIIHLCRFKQFLFSSSWTRSKGLARWGF